MNTRQARKLRPVAKSIIGKREDLAHSYALRGEVYRLGGGWAWIHSRDDPKRVVDPAWRIYTRRSIAAFDLMWRDW